jgi:hypothetical protein
VHSYLQMKTPIHNVVLDANVRAFPRHIIQSAGVSLRCLWPLASCCIGWWALELGRCYQDCANRKMGKALDFFLRPNKTAVL